MGRNGRMWKIDKGEKTATKYYEKKREKKVDAI